jgi:hypothetical protein
MGKVQSEAIHHKRVKETLRKKNAGGMGVREENGEGTRERGIEENNFESKLSRKGEIRN